jgi:hypothetical protein
MQGALMTPCPDHLKRRFPWLNDEIWGLIYDLSVLLNRSYTDIAQRIDTQLSQPMVVDDGRRSPDA